MPRRGTKKSPGKKKTRPKSAKAAPKSTTIRLNRLLASAGFGSRRQCDDLIEEGRVEVDETVTTKLGTTVDLNVNKVRVDGILLKKQKSVYFAVNKPVGVVTTNRDPQGRPRVIDLVPNTERVFAVGRLDRNSEGLILLTNDGELAQQLAHPKFGVKKVYRVTVAGKVDGEKMKQMRRGIYISEGHVKVEGARIIKARSKSTDLEITLREGKNREIRRILARLGHKVQTLRRIAIGPLRLGDMPAGAHRALSSTEVRKLRDESLSEVSVPTGKPKVKKPRSSASGKTAGKAQSSWNKTATKAKSSQGSAKTMRTSSGTSKRVQKRKDTLSVDLEFDKPSKAGAVIGGDVVEPEAPKPRRKSAGKRPARTSTRTRASGKSASAKRGVKKRPAKKSKAKKKAAKPAPRRGAGRTTARKKSAPKRGGKPKRRRS